jgi:ADP-heptose:LPS heptosyltransferase
MIDLEKKSFFSQYPLCSAKVNAFFFFYNAWAKNIARRYAPPATRLNALESPRILLCCSANLGDVLIACSVVPLLKKKWPLSKIGFLVSHESSAVLKTQPDIDWVHTIPKWDVVSGKGLIHGGISFLAGHLKNRKVINEIKEKQYDLSLELHPFFPNTIPVAWKANIPCRVGFQSAGYDVWLSHPVSFPAPFHYLPYQYGALLKTIGVEGPLNLSSPRFSPSPIVDKILETYKNYLVVHVGTSHHLKEWPWQSWRELSIRLIEDGHFLVFSGKGEKERMTIQKVMEGLPGCMSVCDLLPWEGLCDLIHRSQGLVSVDSVPVHLAVSLNVPFVGLYLYNHFLDLWLPDASHCRLIVSERCRSEKKPCFHPHAIFSDSIDADLVYQHVKQLYKGVS